MVHTFDIFVVILLQTLNNCEVMNPSSVHIMYMSTDETSLQASSSSSTCLHLEHSGKMK